MAFINPYKHTVSLQNYALAPGSVQEKEAEKKEINPVVGALDTAVDLGGNLLEGAGRSLEGIFDAALGLIGGVGGLISKDFREGVQDVIEFDVTDWTGNEIFNRAHRMLTGRDIAEDSYLKDGGMIESVLQGVGGMLPAVAVSVATGGAGAPAAFTQAASMATMATGAAGQATQEAYRDGAGYYQGLAYGAIRGGTEVATEKLFGGLDAGLFGKGFLPAVSKSVADTGVKRFVKGALQEGAEEMVSEWLDPAARSVYQGKEAYKKYLDPAFYGDVWEAGVAGTLTGAAFSGTVGRALSGGAVAEDVQSVMTEVDTLERKRRNLFANDKLTDEANTRIGEDIRENYRVLEGVLKKAPDNKRAAVMEKYELSRWFDEDGALKPEFSARLDARAAARQTATDAENGDPAGSVGLTGRFDSRYHDPDAEEASIDAALSMKGRAAFSGELSKEGKARYRSLKKVMNTFSRVSGDRLHFVIAEESPDTNAYYDPNTDVIVIGADVLERGDIPARGITRAWFETALHEVTHSTEGTEAHKALSERLEKLAFMPQVYEQLAIRGYFNGVSDEISTRLNALLSKETLTEAEQTEVGELSRKVREAIEARIQTLTAKGMLTAEEEAELSRFASESTAIMAERVLNSESFVRRLIREDAGLVEKLLLKIADIKEAMTRVGDKLEREVAREIKAAEDQLLRAVSEEGYRFDGGKFVGAEEDEEKKAVKYSIKRPVFSEEDIQRNMKVVAEMEPVADIPAQKLEKTGKRPKELFAEYFDSLGKNIYSPIYGDIALSNSSVKSEIRHGITAEKIASMEAIPLVIENGEVIFHQLKSVSGVERLVVCAPITIGKEEYYMGVMLQRDAQNQRLYLHSVLSLSTEEEATVSSQVGRVTNGTHEDDNHLFMPSILQKAVDVKRNLKKSSVKESRKPKSQTSVELTEGADVNELLEKARAENAKLRGEAKDLRVKLDELSEVSFRQFQEKIKDGQAQDLFYKLQAQEAARRIYKESKATAGLDELTADMETLLHRMLSWELSYEEAKAEASRITDDFVGKQKVGRKVGKNAHAVEVLETLRSAKIRLTETQVKEVVGERGSYDRFRKSVFGRLKFTKVNGVYLDSLWQEWSELYPELFKTDIAEGDMPAELARIYDEVRKNRDVVEYFWDDEVKEELKFKIFENLTTVQHSEESMKGDTMRAVLGRVMEETVTNQSEFNLVRRYREAAAELDEKQETINDLWRQVSEVRTYFRDINSMQTKNTDPETREKINEYLDSCKAEEARLLAEIDKVNAELDKADGRLLQLRGAEPLRRIVRREIKKAEEKAKEFANLSNKIFYISDGVRQWKTGRFLNQSQPRYQDIFNETVGLISKVCYRGKQLQPKKLRELIFKLSDWYTEENMKHMGITFEPEIAQYIEIIGKGEGALSVADLQYLVNLMEYMKHTAENYQKVYKNGKLVDALPEAKRYVRIMRDGQRLRVGKVDALFSSAYMRMYGDPHMIVRYMDKYQRGFYTEMYERLREGGIMAELRLMDMHKQIEETMKPYKHYFKELEKRKIHLHGEDMPVADAMSLYLSLNREQAMKGLLENGYCFKDDDPKQTVRRVFGLTGGENVTDENGQVFPKYRKMIESLQAEIWDQLSKGDQAYMGIVVKLMGDDCKKLKRSTDILRMGYSNAVESFYYPIRRAYTAQNADKQTFFDEVNRVSNASFNKNTVKGAANQMLIEPIHIVAERHFKGVAMYAGLGKVIDDFNMLKNLNTDETDFSRNKPLSVASEEDNTWPQGRAYFEKLISDIQGIKTNGDELTRILGKIRGNYAKFALSANPKVIMTQISSVFAAGNVMDFKSLMRGFTAKGGDVFKYCDLVELRAYDNQAARAQGLLDSAGDALMKPIGWTDSFVVRRLFVAAQYQVAKDKHLELNTEENKRAAGELLREVILETQQNALASEKSEAARSTSEIQKMLTMFTSDAVKLTGRLLDAWGEVSVIKRRAFLDKTDVPEGEMRAARRRLGKALGSLAAVAIYTTLLTMGVRWFLNKDDEEATWLDWLSVFFGSLLGGLPIINDVYERFFGSGYGLEDMSVSAFNDMLDSFDGFFSTMGNIVTGNAEGRDIAKESRKMLYSIGQVTGIPTRNFYNWTRGVLDKIAPEATYKLDGVFYKPSYNADIKAAIEAEDEDRLSTIVGVMLDENVGEVKSSVVRQEMNRLVVAGMDVLPRGVGDVITYEGQSVKLTAKQKAQFRKVYDEANEAVSRMVSMKLYTGADDEAKAKAIKRLYGIYYNRAIEDLLGVDIENKNVLMSRAVDPAQLSIIAAVCAGLGADVGKDGKAITGSKKSKVISYLSALNLKAAQKHLILGYLGYKNTQGEEKVRAYLAGLGLGRDEVKELLSIGGY
ncbi:MAG: hypothetical protein J6D21_07440 [Clostridia bacterium]|nr:hypothetical protein [Clostridia bacterium]